MKIVFSGGGTLGPVTPLLAIAKICKEHYPNAKFIWVGTNDGPEKDLVEKFGMQFVTLTSGKLRRYFSLLNFFDLFKILAGFFESCLFISKEKPNLLISAGGFVSVPLHWAGYFFGIKSWIHQQDFQIGLANKLMAPVANTITVALEKNLSAFNKNKTIWLGNPVRDEILKGDKERAKKRFGITSNLPVVLATGGGTGSLRVNQLIIESLQHLDGKCEVIHLTGKDRTQEMVSRAAGMFDFYHQYQFFTDEMADAYALADIIISRGGFGSISEIAALSKAAILIPKPGHQFDNVKFISDAGAAIFIDERIADGNSLAMNIKDLINDEILQRQLGRKIADVMPLATSVHILEIFDSLLK